MTAAGVTKRARILACLETHPGRTAYEVCVALNARRPNGTAAGSVFQLLRDMERKAEVVATKEFRPQQGRQVNLWHLAPAGTAPPPASPPSTAATERDRARNRVNQRRLRARRRGPSVSAVQGLPDGPACRGPASAALGWFAWPVVALAVIPADQERGAGPSRSLPSSRRTRRRWRR